MRRAAALCGLLLCARPALGDDEAVGRGPMDSIARGTATPSGSSDDPGLGRRLQEALRRRGAAVHRCYAAALDLDDKAAGELLIQVELGEGGKVRRAEVLKDQSSARGLAACLAQTIGRWALPELQAAPGDQVVFPLAFRPDGRPAPPVVVREAAARLVGGTGGARRRTYVDGTSHPATMGKISLIVTRPGPARPAAAGGATVLYVLEGGGKLHGGSGLALDVSAGDGLLVPAGASFALTGELRYVEFSEFPAPVAPAAPGAPLLVRGAGLEPLRVLGNQGRVKILIDQTTAEGAALSLAELTCETGARVPEHMHESSDELLYIVSGRGLMSAGAAKDLPVGPGDAVRIPRGLPHGLVVKERLTAVQSYAPAGPEQRFRRPAP